MEFRVNARKRVVEYKCPACGSALASSFAEAGTQQRCPECHQSLIVPGREQVDAQLRHWFAEAKVREAENERRRAGEVQTETSTASGASADSAVDLSYTSARGWGDALIFVGVILIFLGSVGLLASLIALVNVPARDGEMYRLQMTCGVGFSLGTMFSGCALGGLGHVLLLLRDIARSSRGA